MYFASKEFIPAEINLQLTEEDVTVDLNIMKKMSQTRVFDDKVNWEEIFIKNNRKLQNFIRKRVSNREDVEDILQMTCLEVLRNCHKFAGESRPETWMFGIAVNLIRNYYKTQQERWQKHFIDDCASVDLISESDPSDITEKRQTLDRVLDSIALMPTETRTILTIVVEDDRSYQDAAEELSIPIGTVRSRLSRAREALKEQILN